MRTSGLIAGNSAAIKCLSSTLEKSPVYKILKKKRNFLKRGCKVPSLWLFVLTLTLTPAISIINMAAPSTWPANHQYKYNYLKWCKETNFIQNLALCVTVIAPKFDSFDFDFLMKINCLNLGHAVFQICLIIQHVFSAYIAGEIERTHTDNYLILIHFGQANSSITCL